MTMVVFFAIFRYTRRLGPARKVGIMKIKLTIRAFALVTILATSACDTVEDRPVTTTTTTEETTAMHPMHGTSTTETTTTQIR